MKGHTLLVLGAEVGFKEQKMNFLRETSLSLAIINSNDENSILALEKQMLQDTIGIWFSLRKKMSRNRGREEHTQREREKRFKRVERMSGKLVTDSFRCSAFQHGLPSLAATSFP